MDARSQTWVLLLLTKDPDSKREMAEEAAERFHDDRFIRYSPQNQPTADVVSRLFTHPIRPPAPLRPDPRPDPAPGDPEEDS